VKKPSKPRPALLTRADLVNPFARVSFWERVAKSGAVDLRNNHTTVIHPSGYVEVVLIDPSNRFRGSGGFARV